MFKIFTFITVIISSFSYALKVTEVYQITGINSQISTQGWIALNTKNGNHVFVKCSSADFDDVERDRVGGFKNTADCTRFLELISKNASNENPAQVTIGENFIIELTINY